MASDEAKVRVRLDTRQAKSELRGLTKEGAKTAGRVGGGVRRALGRGLGAVGLGVGIGAGMQALRGPTQGGISALISQTLGAAGHQIAKGVFGDKLPEAIGGADALQKLRASHGFMRGLTGKEHPSEKPIYDFNKMMATIQARGDQDLSADPQFRNEAAQKLAKKLTEAGEAMQKFYKVITGQSKLKAFGPLQNMTGAPIRWGDVWDHWFPKKKGGR
jgi:hypothetical protein